MSNLIYSSIKEVLRKTENIDEQSIGVALTKKLTNGVITKCDEWISNAAIDINRNMAI